MLATGKCPKCEKLVDNPQVEHVQTGNKISGPLYPGVNITCQHCRTIIGSAIDPTWLEKRIVDELLDAMGIAPRKRR